MKAMVSPLRGERAAMRGRIDAQRQTAGDDQPGVGKGGGKTLGVLNALRRRIATADDGQRRTVEQFEPTAHVKQRRRIGDFAAALADTRGRPA